MVWQWYVSVLTCRCELFLYRAAPAQPPLNVEWTLIGSQLSLYWEPVVAMESESEVTGYQVSFTFSICFTAACLFRLRVCVCVDLTYVLSHSKLSDCKNTCLQCVTQLVPPTHHYPTPAVIQETETQRGKHTHNSQFNSGADPPRGRWRLHHPHSDAEWRRAGPGLGSHTNPPAK